MLDAKMMEELLGCIHENPEDIVKVKNVGQRSAEKRQAERAQQRELRELYYTGSDKIVRVFTGRMVMPPSVEGGEYFKQALRYAVPEVIYKKVKQGGD